MKILRTLCLSAAMLLAMPAGAQDFYARQPLPVKKASVPTVPKWTPCAVDFGVCAFNGPSQIQYGIPGTFIYTTVNGSGAHSFYCHPDSFTGQDPVPFVQKTCYYDARTATG